jgi:hypothetical protein
MRPLLFSLVVAVFAAAGWLSAADSDLGTQVVLTCVAALFGLAIGGALVQRKAGSTRRDSEVDDAIPGLGTSTADIASNYWRDKGYPPLMKPPSSPPDQHIHDPDRLV